MMSERSDQVVPDGAHRTRVRVEIRRRPRAGESAETERSGSEEMILRCPSWGRRATRLDAMKKTCTTSS